MANDKEASDVKDVEKVKNLHVEVPESFHTRVKMLCVMKKVSLMSYALAALEEKVARDEVTLAAGPRS